MKLGERATIKRKLENQNPEDQTNNRIKKFRKLCWESLPLSVWFVKGVFTGMVLNSLIMILILIVLFKKLIQGKSWICCACDKYFKKKLISGQSVINKLEISASLEVLISLNRLERVLISKIILFKKVTIMPKGKFPN